MRDEEDTDDVVGNLGHVPGTQAVRVPVADVVGMKDVERSENGPMDRLTRICDDMTKTFDAHPEHQEGDKCIVFLGDSERAGIVLHGYDDQTEATADLLMHLKAMFASVDKRMDIMFMDEEGVLRG